MAEALRRLRATSRGAALVGDPACYGRFGVRAFPGLGVTGCPPKWFRLCRSTARSLAES
ncbi:MULTISPECIES: hypothetical protein [unclassified Chelatococcus]|uniref:hypothetical protein n=1 Tax=unclassified Chelatococcus TaxID=2638111 RepID=UPI0020BEAC51|nr:MULTISPECIES: hypothetical protein [unclassified Chelatococcus]MCO5079568.1 hypothetical protein [Chelatococcus sp.]CAH1658616.1 hypothetical protein CHELA41_21569 [Hyphomicrobiales bacterium]CAH1684088.1 hypothetical protein CHELA20_53357 [Hyphomicrobiales bacterium]